MAPSTVRPPTLHRSCQACIRSKRRCDQRWPHCTRCLSRKLACEYINVPLSTHTGSEPSSKTRKLDASTREPTRAYPPTIYLPPPLEIRKDFKPSIIAFLVSGIRSYSISFVQDMKTHFIHPELWSESWEYSSYITPPPPIQQIHTLCHLYTTNTPNSSLPPLLKDTITSLSNRIHHPTTFTTLLSTTQALLLAQSMLLLTEDPATPYSESTSAMLYHIGHKLWAQAPIQLPNSLSPRKAWLMGETVRRTIIISFVLRSVYSMLKRGYSVRTPFIDALPFDLRTVLWDDVFAQWNGGLDEVEARDGTESMVSLYQYSAMLESGAVHGISEFGGLVLAACRGIGVEEVPFPSVKEYRCSSTIGVEPVKWH